MRLLKQLGAVAVVAFLGGLAVAVVRGGTWGTLALGLVTAVVADGAMSGPTLLSGGEFGPEASLPAVMAGAVLTVVFMRLARRRGHVVARRRRVTPDGPADTLTR